MRAVIDRRSRAAGKLGQPSCRKRRRPNDVTKRFRSYCIGEYSLQVVRGNYHSQPVTQVVSCLAYKFE